SDITALHVEALAAGVASLHGPNAAGLGRSDHWTRRRFISALETPIRELVFDGLTALRAGSATGVLAGGNLSLLVTCQATGRLRLPANTILALEDVTESSYRVDRMLSALLASGALDRVVGVVLGDFTDCPDGVHRVPLQSVLVERLGELGVPILQGLRFGHERWNDFVPLGVPAELDAGAGRLIIAPR
ncbi:MAG TPA: LD-carboxypeptidase, partial [Polyangiaceae bacterium]|nr:LD-carboxypeptidase [Polyangiaceae bacterium]